MKDRENADKVEVDLVVAENDLFKLEMKMTKALTYFALEFVDKVVVPGGQEIGVIEIDGTDCAIMTGNKYVLRRLYKSYCKESEKNNGK